MKQVIITLYLSTTIFLHSYSQYPTFIKNEQCYNDLFNSKLEFIEPSSDGHFFVGGLYNEIKSDGPINLSIPYIQIIKTDINGSILWKYSSIRLVNNELIAVPTSDGGCLIGGSISNYGEMSSISHGEHDYWLLKIDSLGQNEWERAYGGSNFDQLKTIIKIENEGFLLGGSSYSNDGDVESGIHGNTANSDYWIVRINKEGNIIWEQTYGGSNYEELFALTPAQEGDYIIGGITDSSDGDIQSGYNGVLDAWVIKIDASGKIIWEQTYGGSKQDNCTSIISDSNGDFLISGFTLSQDGDVQSGHHGWNDAWIVKIDNDGNILWERALGGSNDHDWIQSIHQTNDKYWIVVMATNSTDGNAISNHGEYDILLLKIDNFGNIIWEKTYGGTELDYPAGCFSSDNGFIIGGNTLSRDGDIKSDYFGDLDCWLFEIDNDGNLIWEQTFGGSANDQLQVIAPAQDGYLFGARTLSTDGNIKETCFNYLVDFGAMNSWIVKTGKNSDPTDIILSNNKIDENIPPGTMVGVITSIDEDKNDKYTYELVPGVGDTDNLHFYISNDTLFTGSTFDYEEKSTYSVRLLTIDKEGKTFSRSIDISIKNLNEIYISDIKIPTLKCSDHLSGSIEYTVNEFVPPLSFMWSNGKTTQDLHNIGSGNYSVTITDGDSMSLVCNFQVDTIPIYEGSGICYLTSGGQSNIVHINKGANSYNVMKYIIYREGHIADKYERIGEINSIESYFKDSLINNSAQSYSYKISMIDSCGNEAALSQAHSTIHLSINRSAIGHVNLSWTYYTGLDIQSYAIFRKKIGQQYELLNLISSNKNSYTDTNTNPSEDYLYYIAFQHIDSICGPACLDIDCQYNVKSNVVSTGLKTSAITNNAFSNIKVYPNPITDKISIDTNTITPTDLVLFDVIGNQIFKQNLEQEFNIIDLSHLTKGIYILRILKEGEISHVSRIVKL